MATDISTAAKLVVPVSERQICSKRMRRRIQGYVVKGLSPAHSGGALASCSGFAGGNGGLAESG